MKGWILIISLLLSSMATANLPFYPIQFPRDEGAHVSNIPYEYSHLIEWWYFNGLVRSKQGKQFAFDYAVFNAAYDTPRGKMTKPMVHIQLMDLDQKKTYAASSHYAFNQGFFSNEALDIELTNKYRLKQLSNQSNKTYELSVDTHTHDHETIQFKLNFSPKVPPFLIGGNGMIDMQNNHNSYYYTIPKLATSGTITIGDETYDVDSGYAWMDHQWGDFTVDEHGWEWFSVRLDNGLFADIFLNVDFSTRQVVDGLANIRLENGDEKFIPLKNMTITRKNPWHEPTRNIDYPQTFIINLPDIDLTIENNAYFNEQAPHGYWEGYCTVNAQYKGKAVKGYSFTELVYTAP